MLEPAAAPAGTEASALRPAVFFDRDNTLIVGSDYLGDPREVVLMEGAADCVAELKRMGLAVVSVSNQSGVARGYFTENDVRAVNARLDEMLEEEDEEAIIDRHDFCPHHPTYGVAPYRQACQCRKPKDGMLRRSAAALGVDLKRSWVVGDAPRDIEAGASAGCRTILLNVRGIPRSPAAQAQSRAVPDFQATSLAEVARIIRRESGMAAIEPDDEYEQVGDDENHDAPAVLGAGAPARNLLVEPDDRGFDRPESQDNGPPPRQFLSELTAEGSDLPPTHRGDPDESLAIPSADLFPESRGRSGPGETLPPLAAASERGAPSDRIASTTAQILDDLRRQRETPRDDFNLFRLLAGVMQVLALAAAVWALMMEFNEPRLILAVFLQLLTITLLIASRPHA